MKDGNMNAPNSDQFVSIARHIVSYSAGAATMFAGVASIVYSLHGLTADQVSQLSDAGKTLAAGIASIVGAVTTIASILAAAWAAWSVSTKSHVTAVSEIPNTTVITNPELAASIPACNVVSNAEKKVGPR